MSSSSALPAVRPWEQRLRAAYSVPGGLSNYLNTLRTICNVVNHNQYSTKDLVDHLESQLDITTKNSADLVRFLRRTDLLQGTAQSCQVGDWTHRWLETGDEGMVVALLHSRVRFIGEMLAELQGMSYSARELLSIANDRYGFSWKGDAQISTRRGWLQSAGLIKIDADKKLVITERGLILLARLDVAPPTPESVPHSEPASESPPDPISPSGHLPEPLLVDEPGPSADPTIRPELATELQESSTDSQDPGRFERAVRDAFAYLGFRAEWHGGSGRTDVLLTARLGRSDSYRVAVDAKTTGSGRLQDMQVDWATLVEHRTKEEADHSLLVGPNPKGGRLFKRASDYEVTVLSARQLAELCQGHARAPLGLEDYGALFTTHGEADLTEIIERSAESRRLRGIAGDICQELARSSGTVGYLSARDLWLLLPRHKAPADKAATEEEIQSVLDTLASPLVGAIQGRPDRGYVLATDPDVVQLRLTLLGRELAGPELT